MATISSVPHAPSVYDVIRKIVEDVSTGKMGIAEAQHTLIRIVNVTIHTTAKLALAVGKSADLQIEEIRNATVTVAPTPETVIAHHQAIGSKGAANMMFNMIMQFIPPGEETEGDKAPKLEIDNDNAVPS